MIITLKQETAAGKVSISRGSQGVQGPPGVQGAQGAQGAIGAQGAAGVQGAQGATGSQGLDGVQGAQGATGSQGLDGVQGAQGAQGIQGAAGSYNQTLNTDSDVTFANVTTNNINLKKAFESTNALSSATGTVEHNCANGHIFVHSSISANFTANFTNVTINANNATSFTLVLNQGVTPYVPTAMQIGDSAQTINWIGGTQPGGFANKKDIVTFSVVNNNGTYITLGQLTSFG